tara:strand:- start:660 stop:932 length:273 start_codon:yes stop_codon:yes gene_type:complete
MQWKRMPKPKKPLNRSARRNLTKPVRYILKTNQAEPAYLAALYEAGPQRLMVTNRREDACSYSAPIKAEFARLQLKRLFSIDSVVIPCSF